MGKKKKETWIFVDLKGGGRRTLPLLHQGGGGGAEPIFSAKFRPSGNRGESRPSGAVRTGEKKGGGLLRGGPKGWPAKKEEEGKTPYLAREEQSEIRWRDRALPSTFFLPRRGRKKKKKANAKTLLFRRAGGVPGSEKGGGTGERKLCVQARQVSLSVHTPLLKEPLSS